jgi:hypothetical protein
MISCELEVKVIGLRVTVQGRLPLAGQTQTEHEWLKKSEYVSKI